MAEHRASLVVFFAAGQAPVLLATHTGGAADERHTPSRERIILSNGAHGHVVVSAGGQEATSESGVAWFHCPVRSDGWYMGIGVCGYPGSSPWERGWPSPAVNVEAFSHVLAPSETPMVVVLDCAAWQSSAHLPLPERFHLLFLHALPKGDRRLRASVLLFTRCCPVGSFSSWMNRKRPGPSATAGLTRTHQRRFCCRRPARNGLLFCHPCPSRAASGFALRYFSCSLFALWTKSLFCCRMKNR